MTQDKTEDRWWESHDNLVLLTAWMAEQDYLPSVIADAVEKPWQWGTEFAAAREEAS